MVRASCPRIPHLTFTYNEDYSLQELRNNATIINLVNSMVYVVSTVQFIRNTKEIQPIDSLDVLRDGNIELFTTHGLKLSGKSVNLVQSLRTIITSAKSFKCQ